MWSNSDNEEQDWYYGAVGEDPEGPGTEQEEDRAVVNNWVEENWETVTAAYLALNLTGMNE